MEETYHQCRLCNQRFDEYQELVIHCQAHLIHKVRDRVPTNNSVELPQIKQESDSDVICENLENGFCDNVTIESDWGTDHNGGSSCIQEQLASADYPVRQNLQTKTKHNNVCGKSYKTLLPVIGNETNSKQIEDTTHRNTYPRSNQHLAIINNSGKLKLKNCDASEQAVLSKNPGNVLNKSMTVKSTMHSQEIIMSLEFSDDLSDVESPENTGMLPLESSVNVENLVTQDNYGISEKCIEETTEILTTKCRNHNLNTQWNEAEGRLSEFVLIQSISGHAINTAKLQQEAIKIAHDLQIDEFSNGSTWCRKFMERKGFYYKEDLIVPQKSLVDCKIELVDVLKGDTSPRLRKSYSASFKLQAVKFAEENGSNTAAGKEFGVSEKNIRLWRKTKEMLLTLKPRQLKNRHYKARWVELEDRLTEYVKTKNALSGGGLDTNQLVCKAKEIAEELRIDDFMGTQSWKKKFLHRKGFYVQMDQTIGLKLDGDLNNMTDENFTLDISLEDNNNVHVEDNNNLLQDNSGNNNVQVEDNNSLLQDNSGNNNVQVEDNNNLLQDNSENNNVQVEDNNSLLQDNSGNNNVQVEDNNSLLQDNSGNTNLHQNLWDTKTTHENYLHKETVDVPFVSGGMPPETAAICQLKLVKNRFVCDVCGKSFKHKASIKKHLVTHQVEQYPCDICVKIYNTPTKLKYHRQNHFNKYLCDICGQLLRSQKSLKHHRINHFKMYKCDHCSLCFATSKQHADHIIRHLDDDTATYKCEVCFKSFKYHRNFTRHERKCHVTQRHNNIGSFQNYLECQSSKNICDICGKTFISSVSLKIHERAHREKTSYKCDVCAKTFNHSDSLFRHKIQHGKNLFKCDVCGKTFAGKLVWIEHLNTHSISQNDLQFERPRKAYTAEFKLEVLKFAEKHGSTKAQAKYNVCEKSIRDWKKIKGTLLSTEKTKLEYRRSNTRWVKIEERLSSELLQGCAIRRAKLLHKAKALAKELGFTNFYGNNSWCQRFMHRRGFIYKNGLIVPKQFLDSNIDLTEIENGDREEKMSGSIYRYAYTVAVKLQVVQYAEENGSNRAAARRYGINETCIRNWRQAKEVLQNSDQTKKANRGSPAKWIELESQLAEYVLTQNKTGCGPSVLQVKDRAVEIAKTLQVDKFTCSPSWYHRFKQRKGLCYKNHRIEPKVPVLK